MHLAHEKRFNPFKKGTNRFHIQAEKSIVSVSTII
jgi:hypothetical protein